MLTMAAASAEKATPVEKVIELMNGMLEKGKKAKQEEEIQFAAYKQFCDDTTVNKQNAIEKANEMIEVLKADIFQYATDAEQLGKEIAQLDEDIAVWTGDQTAAKNVRAIEKADYDALHKDYSESVDALGRAIEVLKKQAYDRKQAAFLQVAKQLRSLNLIPKEAKRALDVFLAQDPDETLAVSAPEANAYEFQSQGIIDMLEKLLDKFIDERTTLEKTETESVQAFELLMQDLTNSIDHATQAREEKAALKAKKVTSKSRRRRRSRGYNDHSRR